MLGIRDGDALGAQAERLGASGESRRALEYGGPVPVVLAAYTAVGLLAVAATLAAGRDPLECRGWLGAPRTASWLLSLGFGGLLGTATIAATPIVVRRAPWARALHFALRPAVHGAGEASLLAVAVASAAGEELLFRGLLVQVVGVVASSVVFGALHQVRGTARWGWMAWATAMGLLFGALFAATGSLVGPLVAHAGINHVNLRFLRDNDPLPQRRALGGLLRR
jgi:membrane protease YdiL (CAAX protease family)